MNKQELIKKLEELKESSKIPYSIVSNLSINSAISLAKQLDEPKKVIVPKFVAEWYEGNKHALDLAIFTQIRMLDGNSYPHESEFDCWLDQSKNNPIETLIRMKDGYEVEKVPLYRNQAGEIVGEYFLDFADFHKYWTYFAKTMAEQISLRGE